MKHNLFLDTEFYDYGDVLELISIGIVSECGKEFYAENRDFFLSEGDTSDTGRFLHKHVIPKLGPDQERMTTSAIRNDLTVFLYQWPEVHVWAWYGAYDWVLLCKLFGGMFGLPVSLPHRYRELADLRTKKFFIGSQDPSTRHHALADAKWNRTLWEARDKS